MLRFINICLALGLVAVAYGIYEVKYEARALDGDIAQLRKDIEVERDAVAVLRAEWSLLNRPERIERLAEKHLQLKPAKPVQLVTLDALQDSDFDRSTLIAKEDSSKPAAAKVSPAAPAPAKALVARADPVKPAAGGSPAPKVLWTTATVTAAEAAPLTVAPRPEPEAPPPVVANSGFPVTVSMPGH
jgi:cell division protein FtsL